jgi:hypothetical protein
MTAGRRVIRTLRASARISTLRPRPKEASVYRPPGSGHLLGSDGFGTPAPKEARTKNVLRNYS